MGRPAFAVLLQNLRDIHIGCGSFEAQCAYRNGGNSLAVRLPDAVVKSLRLKSGDEIEIVVSGAHEFQIGRDKSREQALARLRALKKPLPEVSDLIGMGPMPGDRFFDMNVLIYAFAADDSRSARAEELLSEGGVIGVQVLNEFTNVARRKLSWSWEQIDAALLVIAQLLGGARSLTGAIHASAVTLARDQELSFYDALIVAAAADTGCSVLFTEDLQDGRKFGAVTVENPFRSWHVTFYWRPSACAPWCSSIFCPQLVIDDARMRHVSVDPFTAWALEGLAIA